MSDNILETVKTPCIGVCSTGIGDTVCRGCKRYAHEVINWNSYTQEEKRLIDQRLTGFLVQIVETKLCVTNPLRLKEQLEKQQIAYSHSKSPSIWAYELLRAGASQITSLDEYGVVLAAQFRNMNLSQLRRDIDTEFYLLSQAHYERYFYISPTVVDSSSDYQSEFSVSSESV